MSYYKNLQHIVFRTKYSKLTIPEEKKRLLLSFIYTFCQKSNVVLKRGNAYRNHVHLLLDLPLTLSIPDFIRALKSKTSAVFSHNSDFPDFEGWAKGYGCFSVSHFDSEKIINYIKNQEAHHQNRTFETEFLELLKENGITPNEYFLKND